MVAARGYKNISSKLLISLPNTKKKNLLVGDVSIDYQFNFFLYDNQNTPRVYINKRQYLSLYCIHQSLNFGSLQPSQNVKIVIDYKERSFLVARF